MVDVNEVGLVAACIGTVIDDIVLSLLIAALVFDLEIKKYTL